MIGVQAWLRAAIGAALVSAITAIGAAPGGSSVRAVLPESDATRRAADPRPVPMWLSETGLFRDDATVDPRNRPFTPQYPLWSDGAAKARWVWLPERTRIDVADLDAWRFPAGTTFWKEFSWNGRKVETRMIRAEGGSNWTFATYLWTDDQRDAKLAPAEGLPAAYVLAPARTHTIPSVEDCHACHKSSPATILGFSALQLSDDRDPLAPHAESPAPRSITLASLVEEDRLDPPRPDLVRRPPRIRTSDPVARAALGYLSANCGGCHNERGPLARLGFTLLHTDAGDPHAPESAVATTVGAAGRYLVPGVDPARSRLVAPGAPEHSALLQRMISRRPASQMPPLGTVVQDDLAVGLVERWIRDLPTETETNP